MKEQFTAALSKGQDRAGYCVIFRHPLRSTKEGRPGRRVRRGLGTRDEEQASNLVAEMNSLLSNQSLWNLAERSKAERLYHPIVVSAFYDDLEQEQRNPWSTREAVLPLPGPAEGYTRVLFLGTTGAGKTTVVRQLMGTDPLAERFPSTSAAKTTIANLEVVTHEQQSYHAVVTFFTKDLVRQYIDECVAAAAIAYAETNRVEEIERKLLVHNEQRFRLSYLIGSSKLNATTTYDDEVDDDSEDARDDNISEIPPDERIHLLQRLADYLGRIRILVEDGRDYAERELGESFQSATEEVRATLEELLEDHLVQQEEYQEIVDDILNDVESKFDLIQKGQLNADKSGWPTYWTYETEERTDFIKTVQYFSSNYAPNFGHLLTPLVEGIRVSGPFMPFWDSTNPPLLVLMDGEGLGHTHDSSSSISTKITKRYEDSDAIVLVDNAEQPMQAAPSALIRSLIASGYESRLAILFTHFDQIKGVNIPTRELRKEHVLESFDNVASAIAEDLGGQRVRNALAKCRNERTFFVSNIQRSLSLETRSDILTIREFGRVLEMFRKLIEPPIPTTVAPIYYDADLIFRIQDAMQEFHEPWKARLGFPSATPLRAEHWARIKALTRRLGEMGQDEYDNLRPVADLFARLSEQVSKFLMNPIGFEPKNAPVEVSDQAIAEIQQEFARQLGEFAKDQLWQARITEWYGAYQHRGGGSTRVRAADIKTIYETATPLPAGISNEFSRKFLSEVRQLVTEAIVKGGGKVVSG